LKRALKNKLKAVLENTTSGEDAPVEDLNMNEPRKNRQKRTNAAMILAVSMGASSLFVTRQNDQAFAAEPVSNQNTAYSFSAIPDIEASFVPTNSLESQAPTPVTVVASKSVVEPTAVSQVSGLGNNWKVATSGVQVPTPYNVSVPQQFQSISGATVPSFNSKEETANRLSETLSKAKKSQTALNQTVVNPTEPVSVSSERKINFQLKAQQEFALGHLKEKSNRLRDSLAEFRGSEGQKSLRVAANIATEPVANDTTSNVIQTTSQQSEANQISPSTTSELVSRLKQQRNNVASVPESILTPAPASGVLPAAVTAYEVKPGDTFASIASKKGISASEALKVNNLNNANSLQVNQKLTIPANETITAVNLNTETSAIVPKISSLPANAATNPVKPVVANSQIPISQPTTNINFNGIGGDTPVPQGFADTQIAKALPGSKVKRKNNAYVRNLQEEIEKLRDRYRAQQSGNGTGNVVVPVVPQNDTATVPIPVPRASQYPVSIPVPPVYGRQQNNQARPSVSAKEPINPDFQDNSVRIAVPPASRDASGTLGNMRGVSVSPQLPPLAAVDKYLPSSVEDNTPVNPGVMPGSPSSNTAFIWPAKGVLTSGYGWRWGKMHRGVDVAGPVGTPIYAAADGVIEKAGYNSGGYGYLVEIRHADGSMTRYGHNSKLLVQPGQEVRQGQHVSNMGSTGFSTGPHLHFEIHRSGKGAVNPIAFLPPRV
jgi:murein DD-endopeptidase MepM/ murein hydrolase activator NlpD